MSPFKLICRLWKGNWYSPKDFSGHSPSDSSLLCVCADPVICLQRGLEDSLKRLAESDRLKDERVKDLSQRLKDLEASREAEVQLLTEELEQFKLNEVCSVDLFPHVFFREPSVLLMFAYPVRTPNLIPRIPWAAVWWMGSIIPPPREL